MGPTCITLRVKEKVMDSNAAVMPILVSGQCE